jgi:hypothetical protein
LDLFEGDYHTFLWVNCIGAKLLEVLQKALAVLQVPLILFNDNVFAPFDIN